MLSNVLNSERAVQVNIRLRTGPATNNVYGYGAKKTSRTFPAFATERRRSSTQCHSFFPAPVILHLLWGRQSCLQAGFQPA